MKVFFFFFWNRFETKAFALPSFLLLIWPKRTLEMKGEKIYIKKRGGGSNLTETLSGMNEKTRKGLKVSLFFYLTPSSLPPSSPSLQSLSLSLPLPSLLLLSPPLPFFFYPLMDFIQFCPKGASFLLFFSNSRLSNRSNRFLQLSVP